METNQEVMSVGSTIRLKDREEARMFSWGDHPDFDEVETVKNYDYLYKDSCPATTIGKHTETGKFYALDWTSYESHYGNGESEYDDLELYEVEIQETVITQKEWIPVKETEGSTA